MDGMFNLGMYGLVSPQERNDDLKKKRGFFWANRDENQKKRKDTSISFLDSSDITCIDKDLTFRTISVTSSLTPLMEENS